MKSTCGRKELLFGSYVMAVCIVGADQLPASDEARQLRSWVELLLLLLMLTLVLLLLLLLLLLQL